jgi:hypothetical protein
MTLTIEEPVTPSEPRSDSSEPLAALAYLPKKWP